MTRIARDDIILIVLECGCDAVVAYLLPKQTVVGSNPITRSNQKQPLGYGFREAAVL